MGRPSKDLHVVIGVLLLQQLHDLSDAETVEALAFNMAWHYALDVRSEADELLSKVVYGLIMRRRDPGVLHLRI